MPHCKCDSALDHCEVLMASAFGSSVSIHPGEPAFYYHRERSLYCEGEECGKAASGDFSALASDEENNTSM